MLTVVPINFVLIKSGQLINQLRFGKNFYFWFQTIIQIIHKSHPASLSHLSNFMNTVVVESHPINCFLFLYPTKTENSFFYFFFFLFLFDNFFDNNISAFKIIWQGYNQRTKRIRI